MTKTMKLKDLYVMLEPLKKLASQQVPIKAAYSLSKTMKVLNLEYEIIDAQRLSLLAKYTEKDDKDQDVLNKTMFLQDFNEYLEAETEIQFSPIKMSELGDEVRLSASEIMALEVLIAE